MPARFRDIRRVVIALGATIEAPSGSSHWKIRRADGAMYPIPAGHGENTEIGDHYIKALCRFLGVTYADFKKKL